CQPGTREDIIQDIMSWLDAKNDKNVFWLAGLAGSGKSTVAHTFASMLASMSRLGGCFFFARHHSDRNEAKSVMTTLAHALASYSEDLKNAIVEAIDKNVNVGKGPLRRQFIDLIVEPLKRYRGQRTIVIVLDALDECATPAMREDLLTILAHDSARLPAFVRLFVTGRPERDIDAALGQNPRCLKQMIDLDSESNIMDITAYVSLQLKQIVLSKPDCGLPTSWPGTYRRTSFVKHSAGLFVWASTACSFVRGSFSPEKALERLLSGEMPSSATAAIDSLYATALAAVEGWEDEDFLPAYQVVVGTVVALMNPLPAQVIRRLLGPELCGTSIEQVVSSLGCVLAGSRGVAIRVLHPSFSDYLTSRSRCKDIQTLIDLTQQHRRITTSCFLRMGAMLKYNICNLPDHSMANSEIPNLTQLVERYIPNDVQYACRFWAEHVTKLSPDRTTAKQIHKFLSIHALHWMEAMSLTGRSGYIDSGDVEFATFVYDLERFAQTFATVVMDATLHIYVSALPFTPLNTTLHYSPLAKDSHGHRVQVLAGADQQWPVCLRTLEGHSNWVQSVAFSLDGKLASGSDDATVWVWDPLRGISFLQLRGHEGGVTSVAFSSSGGKIISGSKDAKAIVWDSSSGEILAKLEGHQLGISSVTFSPDRSQAVTGSFDTTICFWDASLGDLLYSVDAHKREVTSLAFSARGDLLASGSFDQTLCIWTNSTRELRFGPLEHTSNVSSVVFSHFGDTLASACRDGILRFWNSHTGKKILTVTACTRPISSLAFSHDDTMIGVACNDHTISFWNVETGQLVAGPLQGHSEPVASIAFSADGSIVASGSHDHNIRLWDVVECKQTSRDRQGEGHKNNITSITFNPDASHVATGDSDGMICVWRCTDGKLILDIPRAHSQAIATLAFSPEGDRLISGSYDQLVMVWSIATGEELLGPLDEHGHVVSASAFSADGTMFATGGYDRCIYLWDASTGDLLLETPLEGHEHWVVGLVLSDDGLCLRSLDYNEEELQWDIPAGTIRPNAEHLPPDQFMSAQSANCLRMEENGWVLDITTRRRVCWIPADHRGEIQASSEHIFVVGNGVGLVTILDVKGVLSSSI
ncbi:WD40 repeat-like protein, partial [Ramaria rubella]